MRTIVIGTNHAGTTAVRTLKKLDPKMEVITYDKSDKISLLGCGIALWVKGSITSPQDLFYASPELLAKEGIEVHTKHDWTGIDADKKTVTFKDMKSGQEVVDHYDKLIVATGTWPATPPFKGLDNPNVTVVKNYEQGEKIAAVNNDASIRKVAVVGAGYIGVELVDAFVSAGKEVTLIDAADRIMPNYYDELFSSKVENAMKEQGVDLQLGQFVQEFVADESGVLKQIKTDKGTFAADYAIVCVGVKPQTDLLKGVVELDSRGTIKTNEYQQTSNPDIYGIGDCSQVYNVAYNQAMPIQLATTAVRTGILAAVNVIQNNKMKSPGFTGANAIDVFGWKLASCGVTEVMAKKCNIDYEQITYTDADRPEWMKTYNLVTLKVVYEKASHRIIGAQVISEANHSEVIYLFAGLIQKQTLIDELPLIDIFFLPHFNKPYNFITEVGLSYYGLDFLNTEKSEK